MTIVLAVTKNDRTVIASDTRITYGSEIIPGDNLHVEKIIKFGDTFLGSSGWGLYDNILRDFIRGKKSSKLTGTQEIFLFFMELWKHLHKKYHFVNDQASDDDSPFGDLDSKFLIVNRKGIFLAASNMSVRRFDKYYAIGSGSSYGLGALDVLYEQDLDAEAIARRAVASAITFDMNCGGDIDVRRVK